MQSFVDELVQQATEAGTIVNGRKTKELLIGSVLKDPPKSVTLSSMPVERVTTFRLLGVHVMNDLKWAQHVDAISSKAASCLHFLKQLKRSGAGQNDLLCFYGTVIRPVLKYACPAWHSSLTATQSKTIEAIQRRAMQIIFADNDYTMSLILARMDTLESWHAVLTERFFRRSVLHEASCLHYLLPDKRNSSVTNRLRHAKTFRSIQARTHKF